MSTLNHVTYDMRVGLFTIVKLKTNEEKNIYGILAFKLFYIC